MNTKPLLVFIIAVIISSVARSQEFDVPNNFGDQKMHYWRANWVSHPGAPTYDYGVYHFRRSFHIGEVPQQKKMYISADNRYRVYINGEYVTMGPARGDIMNWRYETVDIAPYLKEGDNTIAALVFNFGEESPVAQMTRQTAFICQVGEAEETDIFTGDGEWKVVQNKAYIPLPWRHQVSGYYVAGPGDRVNASEYPWGWEQPGFDDSNWGKPRHVANGKGRGSMNNSHWYLVPRTIPFMEESVQKIPEIRRVQGAEINAAFNEGKETVIPANTTVAILLDNTVETAGYPELHLSGGKGSKIKITYAESLYHPDKTKGNRNVIEGKKIYGIYDEYYPDGGEARVFKPLWVKTFRYIQFDIETGDEPLVISDYYNVFTAYPFEENAVFETEDEGLQQIWDISWRTSRLCAFETYMDCPYFEQLNYPGDTRVQAMISLFVSGDERLMMDAIRLFGYSITPLGITQGRYPSRIPLMIPTYSLFMISMLHDLHWYRQEEDFVKSYLPSVRNILEYYEGFLDEKNLLKNLEWWQYTDWSYPRGTPPGTNDGNSSVMSLQYIYAIQNAITLFEDYGWTAEAAKWRELEKRMKHAVNQNFYDSGRKLYAETPAKEAWSQHSNIFAILTDTESPENQQALMERVLSDTDLVQTSIYFNFYFFRALKKAGLAHLYMDHLDDWYTMLDYGYTTCGEKAQPNNERSDCHAWSATPCFDYMNILLGIDSAKPGFREVEIKPEFAKLNKLKGNFPHPEGDIKIDLEKSGDKLNGTVHFPSDLNGKLYWKNKIIFIEGGENTIEL